MHAWNKEQHVSRGQRKQKYGRYFRFPNICNLIPNARLCFMHVLTERLRSLDLLCFLGHYSEGWRSCWWLDAWEPRSIQEWRWFQSQRGHDSGFHVVWLYTCIMAQDHSLPFSASFFLFFGKLLCAALALNTARRQVRGSCKWPATKLGQTSVSCCVVSWMFD